jgi:ABC-type phosphate transport system auxiliary subunit
MSVCTSEQASSQERQEIWVDLQSLGQDTQAFRTEAYRLRTAGSLDLTTNERLRAQQLELERRGEALIKRLARFHTAFFRFGLRYMQTFA